VRAARALRGERRRRAHFGLPSIGGLEEGARADKPPVSVKFEIPYFTVSGIQVRAVDPRRLACARSAVRARPPQRSRLRRESDCAACAGALPQDH